MAIDQDSFLSTHRKSAALFDASVPGIMYPVMILVDPTTGIPITSFGGGGGGGTEFTEGVDPIAGGEGTMVLAKDPADSDIGKALNIDPAGYLYVNVAAGGTAGGATEVTLQAVLDELELKADLTETQPVSAASLPLPAGAAIAANQQTDALTDTQLRATPVPVSGTVTANAGTDLNTSLLALEAGGNLAAINAKLVTGTDIGDVTINNGTGAAAVNIQDGGNAITVDGTVGVSGAVDTELPPAAALTDNMANPTAPAVAAHGMAWDGSGWDRTPGNSLAGQFVNLRNNAGTEIGTAASPAYAALSGVIWDGTQSALAAGSSTAGPPSTAAYLLPGAHDLSLGGVSGVSQLNRCEDAGRLHVRSQSASERGRALEGLQFESGGWRWAFDSTPGAVPTTGEWSMSHSTVAATTSLNVADVNAGSFWNWSAVLGALVAGDEILFQQTLSEIHGSRWRVTGTPTDNTTYWTIPVASVSSLGEIPANGAACHCAVFKRPEFDGSGQLKVSAASLPLPTDAATLAEQQTQTSDLDAIATLVQLGLVAYDSGVTPGVLMLGVRNDTPTALTGANGHQAPMSTDAFGRLRLAAEDSSIRLSSNPISGQVGVAGGAGVVDATTQRVTMGTASASFASGVVTDAAATLTSDTTWTLLVENTSSLTGRIIKIQNTTDAPIEVGYANGLGTEAAIQDYCGPRTSIVIDLYAAGLTMATDIYVRRFSTTPVAGSVFGTIYGV